MKKKVTIKGINSKKIDTKYGEKDTLNICVDDKDGNEQWLNGWKGKANQNWSKGDEVEVEIYKNDKGYMNYKVVEPSLNDIMEKLENIERMLQDKRVADANQTVGSNKEPEPETPTDDSDGLPF